MERNNSIYPDFGDNCFASEAYEEKYDWFAYANFYAQSLHKITPQIEKENVRKTHMWSNCGILYDLYNSINSNERFLNKVKKPFVVNTTVYAPGGYVLDEFIKTLFLFFQTERTIETYPQGTDPWIMYKGRDLILPLLYCDKEALDFVEWKADQYLKNGANSVTIIFVFRIKPSLSNEYPARSEYPRVTEYSFAESLNLNGDGSFLSQLANAAEENYKNRPKYKLL